VFGAGELAYLAGLWHDLGKFNPEFQNYLEACQIASRKGNEPPTKKVPHAIHGSSFAKKVNIQILSPMIYGHHGGLPDRTFTDKLNQHDGQPSQEEIIKLALAHLGSLQQPEDPRHVIPNVKSKLEFEMLQKMIFSCLVDADFLDTEAHFESDKSILRNTETAKEEKHQQLINMWRQLEKNQEKLTAEAKPSIVNTVRAEVLNACLEAAQLEPGVFRLLVPTGGGKTLSGLAFALQHAIKYKLERVIFAVPYTSIIEQTVNVYRSIFGVEAVLEHHSASSDKIFNEIDEADEAKIRAKLATQNWDAPLVVTTTVQLFESLFNNHPSKCRKLHNLSKAVIVLDEVQTLPVSLLQPIVSVLNELASPRYGSSIVLCTATQPALETDNKFFKGFGSGTVRDIVPPEQSKQHFQLLKRVEYQPRLDPILWNTLAEQIYDEEQVLVVLNTRKDALKLLDELETLGAKNLFHLSTLLCGQHRREILKRISERLVPENPQPIKLISTQVIEAGVDLDFPTVYRAIGPLERIVQAAGRCNREGKRDSGRVVVFVPEGGGVPKGEYASALAEAMSMLRKGVNLDDPAIFEGYFQSLYQSIPTDKKEIQKLRESFNFPEVAEQFRLIDDDTRPVVVLYNEEAKALIERIRKRGFLLAREYKALQPFVVNIRSTDFQKNETLIEDIGGVNVWHGSYDNKLRGISFGWSVEDLIV
jgi:CRISPR-associated endonuclease/helicase Cas3